MLPETLTALQRKPRGSGASRRDEILAAAKRLFLTEGIEHTTIRKIAADVGVTSGTLYLYFPDKDAITRAIAEDTFSALLVCLEKTQSAPGGPLEQLRAGMFAYVAFGLAHPDEYRLTFLSKMLTIANPGRCGHSKDIEAADRSFEVTRQQASVLIEAGIFQPMDATTAAEVLWCCLHGLTSVLLDHSEHLTTDIGALTSTVIGVTLAGMMKKPA